MFDIAVVGAGPVGLHVANLCEKMGYKVLVLEEDREIGKPLGCSGLISGNIREFFPDIGKWGVIENEVDSAVLHSKRSELVLKKPRAAYVINRTKFDKKLSELVKSEIRTNHRVTDVFPEKKSVLVKTNKGNIECEMLIGCDGANSVVGMRFAGRRELVKGIIGIVKEADRSDKVDLYFDKGSLKDGFFWRIPRGETTEYGAMGKDVKFHDLERFFKIKGYEKFAGMIPVGPVRKSYSRRILLIGDAAGQVKPWSGGGVIYGLTCAEIAARVVEKAFRFVDFSEDVLKEYEYMWKKRIGKQIKFGQVFRKFLKHSNDFQLDVAFRTGKIFPHKKMDMDFIVSGF